MDNHISFEKATEMLELQNMQYHVLELGCNWKAIITQYGGRLLGPFRGDSGESVLWMNSEWKFRTNFQRFIIQKEWNLGGERFWVNPELRFFCKAPELFTDTYTVQPELDPGNYSLTADDRSAFLSQDIRLTDLNDGSQKAISIRRRYMPAANPLEYVSSLKESKLDYCGYVQEIELASDTATEYTLEPWTVTQVNPDGKFIVPFFGDFDFADYYANDADEMQSVHDGYVELTVNGARKYKLAYRAAATFGRMAYLKKWGDGWHLMIRNYYNDPSLPYCAEPFGDLGNRGCSMYFYNDRGIKGGFAEFEHSGTPIGGDTGRSRSISTCSNWFFFGDQAEIADVLRCLLGIRYKFPE